MLRKTTPAELLRKGVFFGEGMSTLDNTMTWTFSGVTYVSNWYFSLPKWEYFRRVGVRVSDGRGAVWTV